MSAILDRDAALAMFVTLSNLGYGVAVKHINGQYFIEVPVRLRRDKSYGKEAEITALAFRAGFTTVQAGGVLRIVG